MGLHEFDIDEILVRATLKGIVGMYRYVSGVFDPDQEEVWTVWPKDEYGELPPMTYTRAGIEDYCAALIEAGV